MTLSPVLGKASVSSLFRDSSSPVRIDAVTGVVAQTTLPSVATRPSENPPFPVLGPGPRCVFQRLSDASAMTSLLSAAPALPPPSVDSLPEPPAGRLPALATLAIEIRPRAPPASLLSEL